MPTAREILAALPISQLHAHVQAGNLPLAQAFVAEYASGRWLGRAWASDPDVGKAVDLAVTQARSRGFGSQANYAMIVVPFDRQPLTLDSRERRLSNVHCGVVGVGIEYDSRLCLASPTESIAKNHSLEEELDRLSEDLGQDVQRVISEGRAFTFRARQFHVQYAPSVVARELLRGNGLVTLDAVRRETVLQFESDLSSWMVRNVREVGRVTYRFLPSRGAEDREQNNMVRQAMASICLGRIAARKPVIDVDRDIRAVANRNLRHNLLHYYKQDETKGWIEDEKENMAYLGSTALSLIAILESSIRSELADEERGLRAGLDYLFNPRQGSFRMFYWPESKTRGQNYFPGETLLAWAISLQKDPNEELHEKILKSYRYYRGWHLEHRNPAFVPWHTQAYKKVLELEDDPELLAWVFEMNDWLLDMQKNSMVEYPDTLGRFYDPTHPYGPPHASSTGVYLEGLIDAFELARKAGDESRADAYRRSIVLGIRSAMQLEFVDDIDMFYVAEREFVRGGLRTTVYNNQIRVDNVQHVLMAVQKILDVFSEDDYVVETPT